MGAIAIQNTFLVPRLLVVFVAVFVAPALAFIHQYVGCFDEFRQFVDHGHRTFQSAGSCSESCDNVGMPYAGLTNGSVCLCSDELPGQLGHNVPDESCNMPCDGYTWETCGGSGYEGMFYSVYYRPVSRREENKDSSGGGELAPNPLLDTFLAGGVPRNS